MQQEKIREEVLLELYEMKRIGVRVPKSAFELAKTGNLDEYECMSVSEIVNLLIEITD